MQFQTLMLSTLFTGALGIGGFWALKQAGLFAHDTAELPSAKEAARIIQAPTVRAREREECLQKGNRPRVSAPRALVTSRAASVTAAGGDHCACGGRHGRGAVEPARR